jgi:molybdate transport system ATP-binding protein
MTLDVSIRHAFPGFSLDAAFTGGAGVTALFGRSGSGKTTLVQAVSGLLLPDAGHVRLNGDVLWDSASGIFIPSHRRRIGYVFQEGRLFPHLTVRQNLLYGHAFNGGGRPVELDRIVDLLGLAPLLARRPAALSGGEKQRVAIGRALLSRPRLLLMDEPLAALDEARKAEILPYLERLTRTSDVPVLYVSHSLAEVTRLASRVVLMEAGRVRHAGTPGDVLADPQSLSALGPSGAGALLEGIVRAHTEDGLTEVGLSDGEGAESRLLLPRLAAGPGERVRLRIEAEDILLSRQVPEGLSALNVLPAKVTGLTLAQTGSMLVQLASGSRLFLARITTRSAANLELAPDVPCFMVLKSVAVIAGGEPPGQEGR